jgi:hypothetical protein
MSKGTDPDELFEIKEKIGEGNFGEACLPG